MSADPLDQALQSWEAQREIDELKVELAEVVAERWAISQRFVKREMRLRSRMVELSERAHDHDFRRALVDADDHNGWKVWHALVNCGVSSLAELSLRTDGDLLAINGIGPTRLQLIREVQASCAA